MYHIQEQEKKRGLLVAVQLFDSLEQTNSIEKEK